MRPNPSVQLFFTERLGRSCKTEDGTCIYGFRELGTCSFKFYSNCFSCLALEQKQQETDVEMNQHWSQQMT